MTDTTTPRCLFVSTTEPRVVRGRHTGPQEAT